MGVLLAAACGVPSLCAAPANAALEPCKRADSGRTCATLAVPLDRTGAVPGTVKLRIERQKAKRAVRPPLFLLTSGPGQSATDDFDSEKVDDVVGTEARSRDIVVVALRGSGRSGRLDCPSSRGILPVPFDVAACAAKLGSRRDFYSSVDLADDLDAVRAVLGAERIALYGVSYGTHVAQVYARRHPSRVDRLVLDSVVGPDGVDAFERPSLTAMPTVVENSCGKRCRRFLRDPAATAGRVAARLDRRPLRGYVVDRAGRRRLAEIDGRGLLDFVAAYPLVGDDLPALVAAAAHGDAAPLLRAQAFLHRLFRHGEALRGASATAAVATRCSDTQLPWSASIPVEGRRGAAAAVADALPADAFAPFSRRTALTSHVLETCVGWPSSHRRETTLGPLPDVPALLLAGAVDVNTPIAGATALRELLPQAQLVVVPGAAAGAIEQDWSDCAGRAVRRFLAGGQADRCGRSPRAGAGDHPPPPTSLGELRPKGVGGRAGRTVAAVQLTAVEAFRSLLTESFIALAESDGEMKKGFVVRAGALRAGSYAGLASGFALKRASHVPGVRVDGRVRIKSSGRVRASFSVAGRAAARGRLALRGKTLVGAVGGRRVKVRFELLERAFGIRSAKGASFASWSDASSSAAAIRPWERPGG